MRSVGGTLMAMRAAAWLAAPLAVALSLVGCGNEGEEGPVADVTPPVITAGPTVTSLTTGTARITWTTDESANSVVRYGPDTTYALAATDPNLVKSHAVVLRAGLFPDSLVYYAVESTDASENKVRQAGTPFTPPHASLGFSPDTTRTTATGGVFGIWLNVGAVTNLFGVAITFSFDPSLVTCDSITVGSFLGGGSDTVLVARHVDNVIGEASIGLTRIRPAAGMDGTGGLAIFWFRPVAAGNGSFTVETDDLELLGPDGEDMVNLSGLVIEEGILEISP